MKITTALLAIIMVSITNFVTAQNTEITATVVNTNSNEGKVSFALYNKTTFMKKPIQSKKAIIVDGKSTVTFDNLAPGEYAILCYHDKNNNDKMDFQLNGMPLENYGATNNVMNFGPPNYDDAKFVVTDKNVSLDIRF